jgi:hypothetical protein
MNKVILIQRPKHGLDISKAARYGDLTLIEDERGHYSSVFDINEYCEFLLSRLSELNYDPQKDYICVVGSMVNVCVALVCVARNFETFKVLLFNSVINDYVAREFEITSLMQKES